MPQSELHAVGSEYASRRHGRGARPGGAGRAPLARGPAPPRAKWLTGQNGSLPQESAERKKHGRVVSRMARYSSAGTRIRRDTLRQHAVAQKSCTFLFSEQHSSVARSLPTRLGAPPPHAASAQREPHRGATKTPPLASPARCPPSGNGRSRGSKDLTAKGGRKPRRRANRMRA